MKAKFGLTLFVNMIQNYLTYLDFINKKLQKFFEAQSPYIFCQKGCAKCCQDGEYPFSQIEFDYILKGFTALPKETRYKILNNIAEIKLAKKNFTGDKFLYRCPFLIDNECAVYAHRGIICRSFGLIYTVEGEEKPKIPFCAYKGLNYSNVFDTETGIMTTEKYKALNIPQEPLAYNVSYNFLTGEHFEKMYNFKFGDKKPLIDWF